MSEMPKKDGKQRLAAWGHLAALVLGAILLLLLFPPRSCRETASLRYAFDRAPVTRTLDPVMTTRATVTVVPNAGMRVSREEAAERALAAIERVAELMGPAGEKSDIRRFNEAAPGEWVAVDPLTWRVLEEARRFHILSGGAFDITVGPLMKSYAWSLREEEALPSPERIAKARETVGMEKVKFAREGMRVAPARAGMRLDLGAIAKGFAVDQAIASLKADGVADALVEVGGEVRAIGRAPIRGAAQTVGADGEEAPTRPWRVGVRDPRGAEVLTQFELPGDRAVATSGDYAKYFEIDGERYSHIVDPRTGRPRRGGLISVTVVVPGSCLRADALATTVSVTGLEEGRALLQTFPGVEYCLVDATGGVQCSPGLQPPTSDTTEPAAEDDADEPQELRRADDADP